MSVGLIVVVVVDVVVEGVVVVVIFFIVVVIETIGWMSADESSRMHPAANTSTISGITLKILILSLNHSSPSQLPCRRCFLLHVDHST